MLEIDRLSVNYGAVRALDDVSLAVQAGGVCAVIGANGAGKSTLMKALIGLVPVRGGRIRLQGQAIESLGTEQRVALAWRFRPKAGACFPS